MSELKLREFGARAEELVNLPDLAELEHRGRDLRHRRVALVAAHAACVLAVVGGVVVRQDAAKHVAPINRPDGSGGVQSYPGNVMEDLDVGTYELYLSPSPEVPKVRFTLPAHWNAWEGPNRFNGHARGRSNGEALDHLTWYVGVIYLDLVGIATEPCGGVRTVHSTVASATRALTNVPGHRVVRDADPVRAFGYPATHFTIGPTAALDNCPDAAPFLSATGAFIGPFTDLSTDAWVVDVRGQAIVVFAMHSKGVPPRIRQEQEDVLASTKFTFTGG